MEIPQEAYEGLSYLLAPESECKTTGSERAELAEERMLLGQKLKTWIFTDSYGSHRFVMTVDHRTVSALQFMSVDGKTALLANAFTHPDHRRKGYAAMIFRVATRKFVDFAKGTGDLPRISFSKDRSRLGQAFVNRMLDRYFPCTCSTILPFDSDFCRRHG